MDVHPFRVEDDSEPPNVSDLHEFVVKVLPVDDILPSLYPNTSLHVSTRKLRMISNLVVSKTLVSMLTT